MAGAHSRTLPRFMLSMLCNMWGARCGCLFCVKLLHPERGPETGQKASFAHGPMVRSVIE